MFEQDGLYFFKFKYMVTFYNNFHIFKESESLLQISKKCFKKCEYLEHFNKVSKGPLVKTENFRDGPLWNWNNKYMNLETKNIWYGSIKTLCKEFHKDIWDRINNARLRWIIQFQPQKNYFFHDRKATFTTTKKEDINRPVYLVLL